MSQAFSFSQQVPEPSQAPPDARPSETNNLANMDPSARSRLITDLSRFMLFKALSGEPIDRSKLAKESFPKNLQNARVVNAAVKAASTRMQDVFGLSVKRAPESILTNKQMPSKYKERLFVVNEIQDDESGSHSKALHGIHLSSSIEKGLLMLVLAFIYCKGEVKDHMRWLNASALFRLLHSVDENIAAEPAAEGKNKRESISSPLAVNGDAPGVALTPDVDALLEKFVHIDYLVKHKFEGVGDGTPEDNTFLYAIGPRALLVVGLKQIICFCAQVLDQEPDQTMLQELSQANEAEDENNA